MKRLPIVLPALAFLLAPILSLGEECGITETVYPDQLFPKVRMDTSMGAVVIELDRRKAPITVNNFLRYVKEKRYAGTIFHRVMPGFVVQGGGYRADFSDIETYPAIYNESGNGRINDPRSIAMARHDDPHSATSQFYFNLADNESLNPGRRNWGYTVFGTVVEGWEIIEAIGGVETGYSEGLGTTDVPVETVQVKTVELLPSEF